MSFHSDIAYNYGPSSSFFRFVEYEILHTVCKNKLETSKAFLFSLSTVEGYMSPLGKFYRNCSFRL